MRVYESLNKIYVCVEVIACAMAGSFPISSGKLCSNLQEGRQMNNRDGELTERDSTSEQYIQIVLRHSISLCLLFHQQKPAAVSKDKKGATRGEQHQYCR